MFTYKEHRERVRKRFRDETLENFSEIHALELLLFYAIPQKDTKPLARELLNRFGSFSNVMEAPYEELVQVKGIGPGVATYLMLINEAGRYQRINSQKNIKILKDINACGDYLVEFFNGRRNETVYLLCLDAKQKVRGCMLVSEGGVNAISLSVRKVAELAMAANATSVILAHNHPGGFAFPSNEDVAVTRQVGAALYSLGIILADHIVVSDGDYVSLVQSGFYRPNDCKLFLD